jgi:hypothetical protein
VIERIYAPEERLCHTRILSKLQACFCSLSQCAKCCTCDHLCSKHTQPTTGDLTDTARGCTLPPALGCAELHLLCDGQQYLIQNMTMQPAVSTCVVRADHCCAGTAADYRSVPAAGSWQLIAWFHLLRGCLAAFAAAAVPGDRLL